MATVIGERKIRKALRKALKDTPDALGAALMTEGYALQAEGMEQTPVEGGILRRSWYVAPPVDPVNPVVEVGVGTKYALAVHEGKKTKGFKTEKQRRFFWAVIFPELGNKPKVGKPRFISDPLNKRRSGYLKRIRDWTARYAARGVGIRTLPKLAPTKPSAESMAK